MVVEVRRGVGGGNGNGSGRGRAPPRPAPAARRPWARRGPRPQKHRTAKNALARKRVGGRATGQERGAGAAGDRDKGEGEGAARGAGRGGGWEGEAQRPRIQPAVAKTRGVHTGV